MFLAPSVVLLSTCACTSFVGLPECAFLVKQGVCEWVKHPGPVVHWILFPHSRAEVWADLHVLLVSILIDNGAPDGILPQSDRRGFHAGGLSWPFVTMQVWLHRLSSEGRGSDSQSIGCGYVPNCDHIKIHSYCIEALEIRSCIPM